MPKMEPYTIISNVHLYEIVSDQLAKSNEGWLLEYRYIDKMKDWLATHEILVHAAYRTW